MRRLTIGTLLAATMLLVAACSSATYEYVQMGDDLADQRRWAEATEVYTKAIELDPRNAEAHAGRCHTLRTTHQLDHALADCDKAIELDPGLVRTYVDRGNLHDDRGDFKLALADYETAIELEPSAAGAYRNRGVANHRQGEFELALADYERAIQLDPQYALAYASRGGVQLELGKIDVAKKDIAKAIELDASLPAAYVNRGILLLEEGDVAGARSDFDKAIELDPVDRDAYVWRGRALLEVGGVAGARSDFDKAIDLDPVFPASYAWRARALIEEGDYEAATADAERTIELDPSEPEGYFVRGLARAYAADDDAAISDYDRAIELAPDHFEAISGRMRAYLRQGNSQGALDDVETLIELVPDGAILYALRGLAKAMAGDEAGASDGLDRAEAMTDDPEELSVIAEIRLELLRIEAGPMVLLEGVPTIGIAPPHPVVAAVKHQAPGLEGMLPDEVAGSALRSYSARGLDYLRGWSRMPSEQVLALEEDPAALAVLSVLEVELDDIEFADVGRSSVDDPPYRVTAFRIRSIPAEFQPLSMVVDHPDAGIWSTATFAHRVVRVGSETMLEQSEDRHGRPYIYDVGDVRFMVTTDDEAWAAEAFARLRPDPVIESAPLFVSLPGTWRPGLTPTLDDETRVDLYDSGILTAAHDGSMLDQRYVPSLVIQYTHTRLDSDVASTLDHWASQYPDEEWDGRTVRSLERVTLPAGEALRLELISETDEPTIAVVEIRYLIISPAGVFDLLFSSADVDLTGYEATFDEMARTFMRGDVDPDGALARLGRGELTRADYEMLAGGIALPEQPTPQGDITSPGPVVLGGRIEVPSEGFALKVPSGWHAIDLTHPDVIAAMGSFDETTRNLLQGRLMPENPLYRGTFAVFGEDLGGFTMSAAEDLAEMQSSDLFAMVAFAPWDGMGGLHECAVYAWDAPGWALEDDASITVESLRNSDYPSVGLAFIELRAGEAAHLTASRAGTHELSIFTLVHGGRYYYLECDDVDRHERLWRIIADSFEFLPAEV